MNDLIKNYTYTMNRRHCKGGIDIYIDGVLQDRCADLSDVVSKLYEIANNHNLCDIRTSVGYNDVDIIILKGMKENITKWHNR